MWPVLLGMLATWGLSSLGKKAPSGGAYGSTGGPGVPPRPPSVLPSGPPGLVFTMPMIGQLYRPNVHTPEVRAVDFKGRRAIELWATYETEPADAPKERHDHIVAMLDRNQLDPPRWKRVTVQPGFDVQVTGDVVSYGGVRLCGPMRTAQAVADAWGALIPTPKIVDACWRARTLPLAPQPIGWNNPNGSWTNPGGGILWLLYYADRVQEEIQSRAIELVMKDGPAGLVSPMLSTLGKDYVLVPDLPKHPAQCAIYGWTKADGTVIQSPVTGASFVHFLDYYDYSQMIRVVKRECFVDGIQADLAEVYQTRSDWVNHIAGQGPTPIRHPSIPLRQPAGVLA